MGVLKKLRKQSRILEYRVRILEDEQRIRELEQQKQSSAIGFQKRKGDPNYGRETQSRHTQGQTARRQ